MAEAVLLIVRRHDERHPQSVSHYPRPVVPEPEVSVVVVTKDRERFLAQTLASLAAQTMSPEIVLVKAAGDNTSDDFISSWQHVVASVIAAPEGDRATARNLGLAAATGKYVMFLDDDDILESSALERMCTAAEHWPAAIVRGAREAIDENTTIPWKPDTVAVGDARLASWEDVVVGAEVLTPSQTLFRRSLTAGLLTFLEEYVPIEDFVFGAQAAHAAGGFLALPDITTGYRVHTQQSASQYRPDDVRSRQLQARERLFQSLAVDRRTRKRSMAHFYLYVDAATEDRLGRSWQVVPAVARAVYASPRVVFTPMWWKAASMPLRHRLLRRQPVCEDPAAAASGWRAREWRARLRGRPIDKLTVSVIIAAHNEPDYLLMTLHSLQSQTHRELEVIVVDDASVPPLGEVVASLSDPRFCCVRLDENRERAASRNIGLNASGGDFFLVLDHDDLLDVEAIENLVRTAVASDADVVFGRTEAVPDETLPPWRSDAPRSPDGPRPIDWSELFRFRWPIGNALYAAWYAREIAFFHRAIPADDYLLAMEAALLGSAVKADFPTGGWRQHARQTSASLDDRAVSFAVRRAQDVFLASYSIDRPLRRRMLGYRSLYQDGYVAWRSGDWLQLVRACGRAAWQNPAILSDPMWGKALGAAAKAAAKQDLGREKASR